MNKSKFGFVRSMRLQPLKNKYKKVLRKEVHQNTNHEYESRIVGKDFFLL